MIHKTAVEKIQNRFLRYLYYKKYHIYPSYETVRTTHLRKEFIIQSLEHRRIYNLIMFAFRLWNNYILDAKILSLFNLRVPTRPTRLTSFFYIPTSTISKKNPINNIMYYSNDAMNTINIDFSDSLRKFKSQILSYLDLISPL